MHRASSLYTIYMKVQQLDLCYVYVFDSQVCCNKLSQTKQLNHQRFTSIVLEFWRLEFQEKGVYQYNYAPFEGVREGSVPGLIPTSGSSLVCDSKTPMFRCHSPYAHFFASKFLLYSETPIYWVRGLNYSSIFLSSPITSAMTDFQTRLHSEAHGICT